VYLEEAKGDLQKAIALYEKILEEFQGEQEIAAKAQLRIGYCYEKLGLKEAEKAFQKVIDNYPGQEEAVKEARGKLAILSKAQAVIKEREEDKGITIRKLWSGSDYGSPSPDGKYFAFHHYRTGDLAIREVATGKIRRLNLKKSYNETLKMAGYSCWSPDGKQIAYAWSTNPYEIRIVDFDGSNPRTVYSRGPDWIAPYAWSPDGKYILTYFMKKKKGKSQIGLLKVEDGSLREFELPVNPSTAADFSPDSRYIALSIKQKNNSKKHDVSLFSIAEEKEIPLVEHPANDHVIGWSPDGQWIFFWSDRSGTSDLWAITVSDGKPHGEPVLIKKAMEGIFNVWLTKTGGLFYSIKISKRDVYVAKLDFDQNKVLKNPKKATQHYTDTNFAPAWSSDGEYIAFASKRADEPHRVLCILSYKTGEVHEFFPKIIDFRNPTWIHWSPDGQSIVHTGIDKPFSSCYFRTDVKTGKMILVFRHPEPEQVWGSRLSKDGKTLFYISLIKKAGMSKLFARNLETQKVDELYLSEWIHGLALSPDDRLFAFSENEDLSGKDTLKILPVKGREPRTLHTFKKGERISTLDWTPDGRNILFSKGGEGNKCSFWTISPKGGEPIKLGITMDLVKHLRIHPDGQHIAFTAGTKGQEIWVMENFLPKTDKEK
jgi:Tol biopolymer transport system component